MSITIIGVVIAFFTLIVGMLQYILTRKQHDTSSNDNEAEVTTEKTTIEITRTKTKSQKECQAAKLKHPFDIRIYNSSLA